MAILRNSSLFAQTRLVLLYNTNEIKKKADADLLVEYIKSPVEETILLLLSDEYRIDRRIDEAVGKDRKKVFWELYENQKRSWIVDYFRRVNMAITQEAVELLLDLVENHTDDLKKECEKLALYFQSGANIDETQIESLIYHSKVENVFTLFESIGRRDLEAALDIYQNIRLSGESDPVQLLGGLVWQFRKLLKYVRLTGSGYSASDANAKLSIRGKKSQTSSSQAAQAYDAEALEWIITLISENEAQLRSIGTELQDIYFQRFLYKCVSLHGQYNPAEEVF